MEKKNKVLKIILYIIIGIVYLFSYFLIVISNWAKEAFNCELEEILFTITTPIKVQTQISY